jgi:hypothetical protein
MGRDRRDGAADEGHAVKRQTRKTLAHFEATHGQPRIKALQRRLAEEHAKVEALADVQGRICVERRKDCRLHFAVVSDLHVGSLYFYPAALAAFVEHARNDGCEAIYCAGDVIDGHKVYRGQEFELRDLGLDAQLARLADVPEFPMKFITGNHDQSFKNIAGVPVGKMIQQARPDWEFLGEEQARVQWETPAGTYSMMLVHPGGGAKAYALSYPLQQHINALEGGGKPDMYVAGHYHKAAMLPSYRNVCGVLGGAFQKQTPFMARNGLAAHVGGWVFDVTVGDGHNVIRGEFVAFYV